MKGTGRIQGFTTSLPGVAQACPDLPGFARICLGAIHAFVMVENDFKWKIKIWCGYGGYMMFQYNEDGYWGWGGGWGWKVGKMN